MLEINIHYEAHLQISNSINKRMNQQIMEWNEGSTSSAQSLSQQYQMLRLKFVQHYKMESSEQIQFQI